MIQAAKAGDLKIFKKLEAYGGKLEESGHMCLSKRRQNSVVSNIIGTAAYYGNFEILEYVLGKIRDDFVDTMAIETSDKDNSKPFKAELNGYTPL